MTTNRPSIEDITALNGKIFAMLNDEEMGVLNFYRERGRKFGISVQIINKADPVALKNAKSKQDADHILKSANSTISVSVSN